MNNVESAVSYFVESGGACNCSQAVLAAYSERFGLSRDKAFSIAAGFGGGMRMAQTCGAVTGAFMILGLYNGAAGPEDKDKKEKTYRMVEEFTAKFKLRNGSVICKDLIGCDISTEDGAKLAVEKGVFREICPKLVRDAAEIIEEMLF